MDAKRRFKSYKSFDFYLLFLTVSLTIFGITLIGSATQINSVGITPEYKSQIIWLFISLIFMMLASFIDYKFILKFYILIYAFNLLLLLLVFVVGSSDEYGISRWIRFGPIGIQPSEFTKIFIILFFAKFLENNKEQINTLRFLVVYAVLLLLPILLIAAQPSLSACLIPLIIGAVLLFEAGLDKRIVFFGLIAGVVLLMAILYDSMRENHLFVDLILRDYQIERITSAILKEDAGDSFFQTGYAVQAIASGQMFGKGLYQGTVNQLNFVAENHNDFIFSVLGEEFGFAGSVMVIILFFVLFLRILYIAHKTKNLSGKLICIGITTMLFAQVFMHICINTSLLPNTGMALPFLSYGGSSLMINFIAIGLVINVGMEKEKSIFEG